MIHKNIVKGTTIALVSVLLAGSLIGCGKKNVDTSASNQKDMIATVDEHASKLAQEESKETDVDTSHEKDADTNDADANDATMEDEAEADKDVVTEGQRQEASDSTPAETNAPSAEAYRDNSSHGNNAQNSTTSGSNSGSAGGNVQSQPNQQSEAYYDIAMAKEAFGYQNEIRAQNGVAPLSWSDELYNSCQIRAKEIKESFSHTRPDGSSCFTAFPANIRGAGENIAYGYMTAKDVTEGWRTSPGHFANMIKADFTNGAIILYRDNSRGGFYWVAVFAS